MWEGAHDVAVVGGGLLGATVALELVTRGATVVLVDRHDEGRATDAGAGILSPETTEHPDGRWFAFAAAAAQHYRTLIERLDAEDAGGTGYAKCGLVSVALHEREQEWFAKVTAAAQRRAPGRLDDIGPRAARELFPPLGDVYAAAHNPDAARVDGRLLLSAVLVAAERRGLSRLQGSVRSLEAVGDRVVTVETDTGRLACGAIVITGGAWSPAFERQLGVRIPVSPTKGEIVHVRLEQTRTDDWPIVQPVLNHYLVSWPGGRVAVGGTFENAGFDARPTAGGVHQLLREGLRIAPGLAPATLVDVRVGLRPVTIDDLPVLGAVPGWSNVHAATGHGANGLLLGPYSSALVARALLGEAPGQTLAMCSPSRFTDPSESSGSS